MSFMKILVTGANGYIGQHVVKELLDNGYEVVAVDFNDTYIDKRAVFIKCDLFSGNADLYEKLHKPQICLHLAWQDGFIHNSEKHIKMLYKHYEFLSQMIRAGVKRMAVMGSMHEVGYYEGIVNENTPCNPISMYGIAKNALRQMLFSSFEDNKEVELQWLRAFYIYGDDERNNSIFTKIKSAEREGKRFFPFTTGEKKYDFIDVNLLAEQIAKSITQGKVRGIINCCSGYPVTLKEKVEGFIKENGYNIKLQYGAFPDRKYDSPAIWGDCDKINAIMKGDSKNTF